MSDFEGIEYYLQFSEPPFGLPRRVMISFVDNTYAIILLTEPASELGEEIVNTNETKFSVMKNDLLLKFDIKPGYDLGSKRVERTKSWHVYAEENRLLIHTKSSKEKVLQYPEIGYVITGKENLKKDIKFKSIRLMSKSEKTPFIKDKYGDDWNDAFILEPRAIQSVPSTVLNAISSIMEIADKCYKLKEYEEAAFKYQKAYHYIHAYYPTDLDDKDLVKITELKIEALLKIASAGIQTKKRMWYQLSRESCDILLGMPELEDNLKAHAKAYTLRGHSVMLLGDEKLAANDLHSALALVDDEITRVLLKQCKELEVSRDKDLAQKLKTFTSKPN